MKTNELIVNALSHGFIEKQDSIDESLRSKFLTNNREKSLTVIDSIKSELYNCKSFTFSVAFISESGLNELKTLLLDLHEKGIKGRIITSNYLMFNSPKMYKSLLQLKNVEIKITEDQGFHSKGYLFNHEAHDTLIIGSSNLTSQALKINHEWNLKISSTFDGEITNNIKEIIEETWNSGVVLNEEWIKRYELIYVKPNMVSQHVINEEFKKIVPNKMQEAALAGIQLVRDQEERKALLVSATGTGKTYLAAFDVKTVNPERVLFVVHRGQILKDAQRSFKRVLNNHSSNYGYLTDGKKDFDSKYLFTTIQSLNMDKNLKQFKPDDFDYIIVDEAHKSGADSYKKVLEYFTPKFLLGMTATPERTDGENIFELFDYNIAYEIRLQEAIEEDMICPFHYFGVTDYIKDGEVIEKTLDLKDLVAEERIDHLIEKINYYGHSGNKVRGLIFTSSIEEAHAVSNMLNVRGYKTKALDGSNKVLEREEVIEQLENGALEYIITVDIFNEGIDIPSVNQVIMMRETQSSIIFIQQLGRGLRKYDNKEFVTIIDYIGNYKNNYLIPIALSGETSLNKEKIRRRMLDTSYISGISSVNFERVAQERIFNSIAKEKIDSAKRLREAYIMLKNRLGRIPMLKDFYEQESVDPYLMSNYKNSYYEFLMVYDEDFKFRTERFLDSEQLKVLKLYGKEFMEGKRLHEIELTEYLIKHSKISFTQAEELFLAKGLYLDEHTIKSVIRMLDMSFYVKNSRNTYQKFPIIDVNDDMIILNDLMLNYLQDEEFTFFLKDIIDTTRLMNQIYDKSKSLKIGELYTRRDASLLLNWPKDRYGVINGYMINEDLNNCPVFVTYNKVGVSASVDYKNRFINHDTLTYFSKNGKNLESDDVQAFINAKKTGLQLHLFLQKDDATHKYDFYYLGTMLPVEGKYFNSKMADGKKVVEFEMKLATPVNDKLYRYITEKQVITEE